MFTTPAEIYEHSFRIHATRPAVREDDREFTYRDIWAWSDATIDLLRELGVGPGDVVAMYAGNRAEWIVFDSAVARLGAVKTPANYMSALDTVLYQLEFAGASVVITDYELGSALAERLGTSPEDTAGTTAPATTADTPTGTASTAEALAGTTTPGRPRIVQLSDPAGRTIPGAIPFPEVPGADYTPRAGEIPADPDVRSQLNFTGGTTGRPKAVAHTRRSAAAAFYIQMIEADIAVGEQMLVMSPLAHAAGALALAGIGRGATVRILAAFDAQRVVDLLIEEGITWTFMVPTMIYRVLDIIDALDELPDLRLRTIVYGAAPMSPTRLEHGLRIFGQVFIQLFGQTEAPQFCTRLSKLDHDPARPHLLASCGNPTLFTFVKVTDDTGAELPLGELGEITVKTPFALTEYVGNPEATAEKFWDGWVRTGDMGVMDADGYVYLKDRRNDMIISGGFNVYSREVEDVLAGHPQVAQAAVIGVPHPDWGEAVHAIIVARTVPEAPLTDAALIEFSRDKLANYARPKTVEFVAELPQTPFGKIDKKALRAPHWEGRDRSIG
ncbi:AMP-binding protein [uncultured Brevibacterium sp.]|uniref:AMP-binding protein n=1 Tax=uncultured Brevibacterium sp. TaxID=189678 RepID=UPI0025F2C6CB|nr:AMP-binding protein [uncultured Brevibacterium sp.]